MRSAKPIWPKVANPCEMPTLKPMRGCDLVTLQVDDVCSGGRVRDRGTVIQKKTGRPVQFEITEQTRSAIRGSLSDFGLKNGRYLFPSRFRAQPHLSTRQYARIVHGWFESVGLDSSAYGTRCDGPGERVPVPRDCQASNISLPKDANIRLPRLARS